MNPNIEYRSTVYAAGVDGYHTYRIPALLVSSPGTLLLFCEGRRHGQGDHGDIDLLLKRSFDQGRTWTSQQVVHSEPGEVTMGNPCPILDRDTGIIHLLFTRDNLRLFHTLSRDDGQTWDQPREWTSILDTMDYDWKRIATGPVHGIQTQDGALVAPLWASRKTVREILDQPWKRNYRAGVIRSQDGGKSWFMGGLVPDSLSCLNECSVAERSDGSLLLNIREHRGGYRIFSESRDGGRTWSDPMRDENLPCPNCQAGMVETKDGELYFLNPAVSTNEDYQPDDRRNLTLRRSSDGGNTWKDVAIIEPGPAGYSDLYPHPDGGLILTFETGEREYQERIDCAVVRFS